MHAQGRADQNSYRRRLALARQHGSWRYLGGREEEGWSSLLLLYICSATCPIDVPTPLSYTLNETHWNLRCHISKSRACADDYRSTKKRRDTATARCPTNHPKDPVGQCAGVEEIVCITEKEGSVSWTDSKAIPSNLSSTSRSLGPRPRCMKTMTAWIASSPSRNVLKAERAYGAVYTSTRRRAIRLSCPACCSTEKQV
jgi:hypothetical protein